MTSFPASFEVAGLMSPPAATHRRILLVGLDGLRADLAIDRGLMPTLAALAATGSRHRMVIAPPTLSGPSWATILTGATIEEHGVTDNQFFGSQLASCPDLLSRAYYADARRKTFAAAAWPQLVAPLGFGPVIQERAEQHRAGLHRVVHRDGETCGYVTYDAEMVDHTVWALRHDTPDVAFVYMCDADESAHLHGPLSDEYRASLARLDQHLERLVTEVDRLAEASGDDWLVAVTTDHGHVDEGGHGGDSAIERESFVVLHRPGGTPPIWPSPVQPSSVTPRLLRFLEGSAPGSRAAH